MPSQSSVTIGIDVGDRYSHLCVLDTETGEVRDRLKKKFVNAVRSQRPS